jgi:cellulose synthase/poly-beta-1,6-N-acetylglucosamine synthase-like glycosyltransferase
MPEPLAWSILLLLAAVLAILVPLAAHRTLLLILSRRAGPPVVGEWSGPLPRVTVQLPLYNEIHVAARLVDAACSLDHPPHLLEVQVLDDSNDGTSALVARRVAHWRERGIQVRHLRRPVRTGFKAGALAEGTESASGEFLLILDADFLPEPDLIRRLLPPFSDPGVGMVQARWDHLNEGAGIVTRAQAFMLDAHFRFEHHGRWASGRFFNFNGTAGIWRRSCLEEAGGWEADTLTEDLDLSYRAQMAGWRFVYRGDVGVPAELPERVGAFEVQQKRWAQGGIQTGRKILPRLLRAPLPLRVKSEAVFHLWGHVAHPLTLLLGVLLLPATLARETLGLGAWWGLDLALFVLATVPFLLFYGAAGRTRKRPWRVVVPGVLGTLAVGIGLSAPVSRAVFRGFRSRAGAGDPFVRTPKSGGGTGGRYRSGGGWGDIVLKVGLGSYATGAAVAAPLLGHPGSVPFLVLFAVGWMWSGLVGLQERLRDRRPGTPDPVRQEEQEGGTPDQEAESVGVGPDPGALIGA